jgi:hypothetical protein
VCCKSATRTLRLPLAHSELTAAGNSTQRRQCSCLTVSCRSLACLASHPATLQILPTCLYMSLGQQHDRSARITDSCQLIYRALVSLGQQHDRSARITDSCQLIYRALLAKLPNPLPLRRNFKSIVHSKFLMEVDAKNTALLNVAPCSLVPCFRHSHLKVFFNRPLCCKRSILCQTPVKPVVTFSAPTSHSGTLSQVPTPPYPQ